MLFLPSVGGDFYHTHVQISQSEDWSAVFYNRQIQIPDGADFGFTYRY